MSVKDLVPNVGRGLDLARRDEWDPFRGFQRDVNSLFDDFFSDLPMLTERGNEAFALAGFSPLVDVSESDSEVTVSAELPGMDEKDITVEMDDAAIMIHGERHDEKEDKGKNWYSREQSYGSFHRVIPLPARVDGSKANAKFEKGVLTIAVAKRKEDDSKRHAITIESD